MKAAVVHDGKLYLFVHGTDDFMTNAWSTVDGVNWELAGGSPLNDMDNFSLVSFKGKLWIFGGDNVYGSTSQVWSTEDGKYFRKEADSVLANGRFGASFIAYQDALLITGGSDRDGFFYPEIWGSEDGAMWRYIRLDPALKPRRSARLLEYHDKLWLFGGWNPETLLLGDAWRSP